MLLAAATMVACDEHPVSVDWYMAHAKAREAKVNECVAKGLETSNCRSAKNAYLRARGVAPTF